MSILAHTLAVLLLVAYCEGICHDIDAKACELMQHQNPNLCQDQTLSSSACPRFCKLCPLVCHHCDASVLNFTDCNTNKTCQVGERCMLHQLTSSRDGHHEYRMTCASLEMCDGTGLMPFGRRDLLPRDIQTHCCSDDMCNYPSVPVSTPPPVCNRDIEILIQDSPDRSTSNYSIQFVKDVVSQLVIGPSYNLIAIATMDHSVHRRFDLNSHKTKTELLRDLDGLQLKHEISSVTASDVFHFLINELQPHNRHGERPAYKNSVLIIADHTASPYKDHYHNSENKNTELSSVTVINVGGASRVDLSTLATDSNHVINVLNYESLKNSLYRVLQLLCS